MSDLDPQTPATTQLKNDFADTIGPLCVTVRDRSRVRRDRWINNHAAWMGIRTRAHFESEYFKHYVPMGRRSIERNVVRTKKTLLPAPTFFEVFPGDEYDTLLGRSADSVRAYMTYLLRNRIRIGRVVSQACRSIYLYDRAILKNTIAVTDTFVEWAGLRGPFREVWPTTRVVDPFAFYVWPETVDVLDDAVMLFEDVMMPYSLYSAMAERGICDPIPEADLGAPDWPYYHKIRLAHAGLTEPTSAGQHGPLVDEFGKDLPDTKPQQKFVSLSGVWWKNKERWYEAWLVWNVPRARQSQCVRLRIGPYPEPPYRMALARPLPGEHYTTGMMDDIEPMQVWLNDVVNQMEENRAASGLPPVALDATAVQRMDSLDYGARAKWLISNPRDNVMTIDVKDTTANGARQVASIIALLNSVSGASPISEGQPTRGLPRAGFAVSSLIALGMADIVDVAEILEEEILTPTLRDLHRLTLAFVPREQILQIPGTADFPPRAMRVQDLEGSWNLVWMGSQQNQDQQMRAQRLITFWDGLLKALPVLAQMGYTVDVPQLAKRIFRDGMGERGVEQFIRAMTPPEAQQYAMMTQSAGGGQGGPSPQAPGSPEQMENGQRRQTAEGAIGQMLAGLNR
jgi:hypothetical protein